MSTENSYNGKLFSILGDSVSTFENYNPPFHPVYYQHEYRFYTQVIYPQDTWWHQVLTHLGGELLVNNSWSGGWVSKLPGQTELYPSGCSEKRIEELCKKEIDPDVIIVYLGTNDWGHGTFRKKENELEYFPTAYKNMLSKIRKRFPDAEVWCCTINEAYLPGDPKFDFNSLKGDEDISVYNSAIKDACEEYGCRFIDIYGRKVRYTSYDGAHPNALGMKMLSRLFIEALEETV